MSLVTSFLPHKLEWKDNPPPPPAVPRDSSEVGKVYTAGPRHPALPTEAPRSLSFPCCFMHRPGAPHATCWVEKGVPPGYWSVSGEGNRTYGSSKGESKACCLWGPSSAPTMGT